MMWRGGKLLSGIKSIYAESLSSVIVKGDEREWFRIDSRVRQVCIISPRLFNVHIYKYMDGWCEEVGEDGDGKE